MLQKFIVALMLPVFLLGQIFVPFSSYAVTTDGTAANWTREKAEHLARRVLFYPTRADVDSLYAAGSAGAAVDILFPNQDGPDRTQFQNELNIFTGTGYTNYFGTGTFWWNSNSADMYRYYQYKYYRDPYQAKAKLFSLFEDTFAVNVQEGVHFYDVINLHDILYKNSLGNYKTMIKQVLMNTDGVTQGNFAAAQFLNLLSQWNYSQPNENYARELLQLFLMGEYLPGESKDNGDTRNYEETDVAALAKVLTGFWSTTSFPYAASSGSVYYNYSYHNNSTGITLLPGGDTGSINFPFYDQGMDTLDLSGMKAPVFGNNGLADNSVDYIFAKKSHAIALFLSNKLYHFYVSEHPTRAQLDTIAGTLEANNFEMLPTVKWLLTQDFMYSDESMNAILYANPLELMIGLFRTIHAVDPDTMDTNFYASYNILDRMGWTPYVPGSIFGRDGFDENYKWSSAYNTTQWTNLVTTVMYDYTRTWSYLIDNIVPVTQSGGTDISMDDFIKQVQDNLILGRELPAVIKNNIKTYLTTSETGATIPFQPNSLTYKKVKFPWVFSLVLSQPEFTLKSGYDQAPTSAISEPSKIDNASGSLVIIELPGGYDWLNGIIQKSDYANYQSYRTNATGDTIAQDLGGLVDLGDYYMNPYLAYSWGVSANGSGMKMVFDEGLLKIFNRVGTSNHSRDHNQAQQQIVSIDNTTTGGMGLLGKLSQYETNSSNLLVMGTKRPNILQGGTYVNLGASDNRIANSNPYGRLNTNQKNQQVSLLMNSFSGRTYPGKTKGSYADSLKVSDVASISVAQGGSAGVGYTTSSQLKFVKTLMDNNVGKVFYLQNTGNGYDTHQNELTGSTNLNLGIGKLASDVSTFFQQVKDMHNVTVVVYSEFGRTNAINGTIGTDHGQGAGMFIFTNNSSLLSNWTGSVYGQIKTSKERDNWLSPGIDYRSIYGDIMSSLYGIPQGTFFKGYTGTLADDLSAEPASLNLLHTEFVAPNDSAVYPYVKYIPTGRNFKKDKGSYTAARYSTGGVWKDYSVPFYDKNAAVYTRVTKGTDGFDTMIYNSTYIPGGVPEKTQFLYTVDPVTDQFVDNVYSGSVMVPEVLTSSVNVVSTGSHSVLRKYAGISVLSGTGYVPAGSGIVLANNPADDTQFAPQDGVSLKAYSGSTYITSLSSSSGSIKWYGGFVIGERMDAPGFIPENAYLEEDNLPVKNFTINNIVRVGSDALGVGMQLSKDVQITMSGSAANTPYYLLTSEDGIKWHRQVPTPVTSDIDGNVTFDTNHFSLFALAEVPTQPLCEMSADQSTVTDGTNVNLTWSTLNADSVSISPTPGIVASSGTTSLIPPSNATTDYTLTATNVNGTSTCHAVVRSLSVPSCTISASTSSVKNGKSLELSWTGVNASSATLAPGGSSVPTSATVNIIPPSNATTNYVLTVANDVSSASCNTSVTTYANSLPIANDDNVNVVENNSALFDILANDTDADVGDQLSLSRIVSNPTHGTAEISGTGVLFTATGWYCGADSFTYQVEDQDGGVSNTATASVNIACGMNPPITSDASFSGDEDGAINGNLTGTDVDGDTLTYMTYSGVSHGVLNLLSDGSFIYSPNANYNGLDTFQYYAHDGTQSGNISTVTLTVNSINDLPVTVADSGSTNMNVPTFIDVLANDTDIDHSRAELNINITTAPMSGSVIMTGGMVEYTPNTNYCGTDSFEYTVTDASGGTSNPSLVDMNILCVSGSPTAVPDTASVDEDNTASIDFITNDSDPDFGSSDSISFQDFVTLPAHGTVALAHTGVATANRSDEIFSYTPSTNYCGTDSFTYRIHDNSGTISNTAFVNVSVNCINDAPTVTDSSVAGYSDHVYVGNLAATDVDDSVFTYQLVGLPTSGTATLSSTGHYTYSPQSSTFSGSDTFQFVAQDPAGAVSNTGTVTFTLTEAPLVYVYTGSTVTATGTAQIFTGQTFGSDALIDLNGRMITANSSGSTGSIVIPGTLDIHVESGVWSGEIMAPSLLDDADTHSISLSDSGVSSNLPSSTSSMNYTYSAADTFKAGSTGASLALTGWYATLEFVVSHSGLVFGSQLQILRSQDGVNWEPNYPDTSCIVDNELKCTFRTNHLTYFGTVQQIQTPVVQPYTPSYSSSAGAGGGGYSMSYAPTLPWLILTSSGGIQKILNTNINTFTSQTYIDWVKKYQPKYQEKYLAEKVYWSILRKTKVTTERSDLVNGVVSDMKKADNSLVNIANTVDTLWQAKLSWKKKLESLVK